MPETSLIPAERIERRILLLRGQKVMLDFHLAELYEVETKALNQAVGRNTERFPEDFMFQLTAEEMASVALTSGFPVPWPASFFSRVAAADSSPRREPWDGADEDKALVGATEFTPASFAPAGALPSRSSQSHGSRRGLLSAAPLALRRRPRPPCHFVFTEVGVAMLSGLFAGELVARNTVATLRAFARLNEQEQRAAEAAAALAEMRRWLERDDFRVVEPPVQPFQMPVVPSPHFAPCFQTHFAACGTSRP